MKILTLAFVVSLSLQSYAQTNEKIAYDAVLSDFPYPFPVQRFVFNSQRQKLSMAYMDIGDKDSKKIVVLLHGKNFSGFYWKDIALKLKKQGYRVIIPDQIGFGKSSKPEHYQYSFYNLSLNTYKLLDHLKISEVHAVGHSMGGMLAFHLYYAYPKRVQKITTINPIGLETYDRYAERKDPDFFHKLEINKTVDAYRNYQRKNYYDGKWSKRYESLIKPFIGWRNGPDWELIAWNNARTYIPIFAEDIVSRFHEIEIPVTLIIGSRDKTGPGRNWKKPGVDYAFGNYESLGERSCSKIKKCTLEKISGLGHLPQFEDFDRFSSHFFKHF